MSAVDAERLGVGEVMKGTVAQSGPVSQSVTKTKTSKRVRKPHTKHYHLMLLPGVIFLVLFGVIPMFGVVIAFQNFLPTMGVFHSAWAGFQNFQLLSILPGAFQVFKNTVIIALGKLILEIIVPVVVALLLNEVRHLWYKRTVQTIVYLPHFMSWVILGGIFLDIFSVGGMANQFLHLFGIKPIQFMASNVWFRPIIIGTDVWKEFGFGLIVYLAAIVGINPALYESASVDGATRWQLMRHVTLPGILSTIVLMATLSLGNVLNANFDQIFNMYNPLVYQTGDIIDTWVYRMGLIQQQYSVATAVGLLKSAVSMIMIVVSYVLARRFANYRIF